MNYLRSFRGLFSAAAALGLCLSLHAQVITSGITGRVSASDGSAVPGAGIRAVHTLTNATYNATTNADGRYYFRSLPVGGPYTVTATPAGQTPEEVTGVTTQLGTDVDVDITIGAGVTTMQRFVVSAERNALDSSAQGASTFLGAERLEAKPTTQRSLADLISASSLVTLRALGGDREEAQLSAVGQNARFNSIMIDGARINDQFGLNMSGLASFFNPLSIDTLEQLSVSVSPYDVRQSGFTGAAINAVTKSGTNKLRGNLYYIFSGDEWLGVQLQGEDRQTREVQGRKVVPQQERTTWGAVLTGPILKNRLFFSLSYEKFEREQPPADPGFLPDASELAAIQGRFAAIDAGAGRAIGFGAPGGSTTNLAEDEKKFAKLDWQINDDHRLSVRYSTTEGTIPQFGAHTATSGARGINPGPPAPGFGFDSFFYAQGRKEEARAGQLVSQWTPNFKTELKYSETTQDQLSPTNSTLPLINILNVNGISQSGTPTTGVVFLGTEFSRQGNGIFVDTRSFSGTADYVWKNIVFTGGFDREETDFINLFRQGSYGQFDFNGTAGFASGAVAGFTRAVYDPALRPAEDISDFGITGVFLQAKWDLARNLSLVAGARVDRSESGESPRFNERLFAQTGFRNTGTVDGVSSVSPRVGFNWSVDNERKLQVRGGVGRFLGRAPWVIFSNSYNNIGVGSFIDATPPASLEAYLRNSFDPTNPIGTGTDAGTNDREVNWSDDKVELPSVWRGNIAADYRLPFLDTVASVEVVQTYNDDALFIRNENLRQTGVGADGRPRFAGNPGATGGAGNAATALYPDFLNLYRITNTSLGESTYITLSLDRPMRNRWSYNISYTSGRSTDAQVFGSTTAGSQWGRNPVFFQNQAVESRSDFEVKNRIQMSLAREFYFFGKDRARTLVSLYYEGRNGSPFSWVYTNDMNLDGLSANDLVAVPSGGDDPRFNFGSMSPEALENYLAFFRNNGLATYAGGYAPRNEFDQPWVNRLDLRFTQAIPLFKPAHFELFLDFTNFGYFLGGKLFNYYERTTLVESDTFWRRSLGTIAYDGSGRLAPVTATALNPSAVVFDNNSSRWRINVGARLKF